MQEKITMDGLIAQLASPTPWEIKHSGACAWQVFDANGVMIMSFLDGPVNTANVRLIVESVNNAAQHRLQRTVCHIPFRGAHPLEKHLSV